MNLKKEDQGLEFNKQNETCPVLVWNLAFLSWCNAL